MALAFKYGTEPGHFIYAFTQQNNLGTELAWPLSPSGTILWPKTLLHPRFIWITVQITLDTLSPNQPIVLPK